MITSNNFFEKHPLWNPQQQLNLHTSITYDHEMGPWNSIQLKPSPYNSLENISSRSQEKVMKNYGSIERCKPNRRYHHKKLLKLEQNTTKDYSTIDFVWDKKLFVKNINPLLKRASHLPVISAREEYGDIFKYTKPLEHSQSSTKSLEKSNKTKQENKSGRKKISEQYSQKPYLIKNPDKEFQPKYIQGLPFIQKYLPNKNKGYNIYERCVVKPEKGSKLRQKQKSNPFKFV